MARRMRRWKSQSGLGIVEAVVVSFVLAAMVGGVVSYFGYFQKKQRMMAAVDIRDGRVEVLHALFSRNAGRILAASAHPSSPSQCATLTTCVAGGACPAKTGVDCAFFDIGNVQITGSPTVPLGLSLKGKSCGAASVDCPLEIVGRVGFDSGADEFLMWAIVRKRAGVTLPGTLNNLQPYDGYKMGAVSRVKRGDVRLSCNPGEKLVGFSDAGTALCKHVVRSVAVAPGEPVPSGSLTCDDGEHVVGVNPDGSPICDRFPYVWMYNNTFFCFEGPDVPPEARCGTFTECQDFPHGVRCEPNGSPFCAKKYGPFLWMLPITPAKDKAYMYIPKSGQPGAGFQTGQVNLGNQTADFTSSCAGCSLNVSKTDVNLGNIDDLQGMYAKVPLASGYLMRIMRCVRPVRVGVDW